MSLRGWVVDPLDASPLPELAALGRRLEELERPKARERMVEAGRIGGQGSGNLPNPSDTGRVRDKVAEALGMSGRTYEKLAAVDKAANNPEEPEAVREEVARRLRARGCHRPLRWRALWPRCPLLAFSGLGEVVTRGEGAGCQGGDSWAVGAGG